MLLFRNPLPEAGTPADLFLRRYKWLFRWAMHFARNDRTSAEDMIQDTFVRFSQANLKVTEIRDPEALLYTYLEHVHMAHRREIQRHSFISLADAKLDALALGILTGPDVDRIETQNILRRIAAYVAWRKQTSKSASLVALRFLHGYLPEEIARMALVSREAVDERLHKGRNETRLHLIDPEKLREIQHGGPVTVFPSKVVVPSGVLLTELRDRLFEAPHGGCMPVEQLASRYRNSPYSPIRRDLLAHIVSCRKCLAIVERLSRQSPHPPASGDAGTFMGMEWRNSREDLPHSSLRDIKNVMLSAERRLREIFENRPTSLIVAVNSEILASRDIGASFNGIKVEVPAQDLKFIEILNEHGASLLSWAVELTPPHSDPVVHRVAEFSMGRRLGVDLQFSPHKLIIDVQYHDPCYRDIDPSFTTWTSPLTEEDEDEELPTETDDSWAIRTRRIFLERWKCFTLTPLTVTWLVCTVLLAFVFILGLHGFGTIEPAEFIQRAIVSETRDALSPKHGVILQQVSIQSSQGTFRRSIYRDPEGKRHLKSQPLDENNMRLKRRLADAGIDWDAPLAASSYRQWHAHVQIKNESVRRISDRFLTLRADTEGSDVEQETITIRTTDFHLVGRTVEFRDLETIEIAELNYAVVPWTSVNQGLFENGESGSGSPAPALRSSPLLPRQNSIPDVELDLAELEVRTALHELHADSSDRLTISRSATGVQVTGMVEDDKEMLDVTGRLHLIPHVSTNLTPVNDATLDSMETKAPESVRLVSVVAEPSLLTTFLLEQGRSREVSANLADRFFTASSTLLRANRARLELQGQFPPDKLSPKARDLYARLLTSWYAELDSALRNESEAIRDAGVPVELDTPAKPAYADVSAEIEINRVLLKELIGHDAPATRTVPMVMADLTSSIESLRKAANEEHEKASKTIPDGSLR